MGRAGASAMALRKELLKSIWYAFTALDVEKSGKVSKSQLKVRGTRGPGEAGRHISSAPTAWEPDLKLLLLRHRAIQRPGPGVGAGTEATWPSGGCCPLSRDQGGMCETLPRTLLFNCREGGGGIMGF